MRQSTNGNQFAELRHRAGIDELETDELAGTGEELPEDLLDLAVGAIRPFYPETYCWDGEEWHLCDIIY